MSATPHSDKPAKDLMRRRIKEDLLSFGGTRLFPKREATTVKYTLSPSEHDLYEHVTEYVRNGMNRAEHRDTLDYLVEKLGRLRGRTGEVVDIHGGVRRDKRGQVQDQFTQDDRVRILVATDAAGGHRRVVSKQFEYVEITEDGEVEDAGEHPYLDCRSPNPDELQLLAPLAAANWVRDTLATTALNHAVEHNVPTHVSGVEDRIHSQVDRTLEAVHQRLNEEINHWDTRALRLKDDELAGKPNARINSAKASTSRPETKMAASSPSKSKAESPEHATSPSPAPKSSAPSIKLTATSSPS